jgi:1-deoxy-D-xylulose-5-phosphate synthase
LDSSSILSQIKGPDDVKKLSLTQLKFLAEEIRNTIIKTVACNSGHLASNLGIVELSIALHYVFHSPHDKIIFDTSHQTYAHKILTGRYDNFASLRKKGGISGFAHHLESPHDHFSIGHAGTAISSALGLCEQRNILHDNEHVIAVIGDGSLTCGLTLEAINNIPSSLSKLIIILNDNKMAISPSVGNIKNILSHILNSPTSNKMYESIKRMILKIPACGGNIAKHCKKLLQSFRGLLTPSLFFEQFNLAYVGPIDGHDTKRLIETLKAMKDFSRPVLIHVLTNKGQGMPIARENPLSYHSAAPFDIETGKFLSSSTYKFCHIFGEYLLQKAQQDETIFAITPAMLVGSGLMSFKDKFPKRCIDVGIAEGHALTFSAALALKGKLKVVTSIYSTFLQRAFDNILQDVAMQNIPLIIAIDRAGLNAHDGCTHHGIYDIGLLNSMPNMNIVQPRNGTVLKEVLDLAFRINRPIAIRYPHLVVLENEDSKVERHLGKGEILYREEASDKLGKRLLIVSLGHCYELAFKVKEKLLSYDITTTIVDPVFIKPLDELLFDELLKTHDYVVTIEEHAINCGFGSILNNFIIQNGYAVKVINMGIGDTFVQHGNREELLKDVGLEVNGIVVKILNNFKMRHYDYSVIS